MFTRESNLRKSFSDKPAHCILIGSKWNGVFFNIFIDFFSAKNGFRLKRKAQKVMIE